MVDESKKDYLFRGTVDELDPDVAELIRHETARQARTLIMIPSESTIPEAVREAMGSAFHNIYAEGYPLEKTRRMTQQEILDYNERLPEFRRYADERYYKGTEYANVLEALTRRRTAEAFATSDFPPEKLYVNVQPLSGAPANNAVYTALTVPGDTVMSMDLLAGGHLSHGAPVNRSGKFFNIVSYSVDPETEQLDYDAMLAIAQEHKPKIIIGGYSSYPIAPDWQKYREIADAVGAYLLADIAHFAGLVAAGVYPNPLGIADILTFTTHKTLQGSRGAVIITHRKDLSAKLDRGVFPGEQGGPHMHAVAGLAVAMRFAQTDQFKQLQAQTVDNARHMAQVLKDRGIRIPHGGTDSHMLVVDLKSIKGADGTPLSGDMAARILDLAGIVCNRQTIPGDKAALRPSGIRLGTPWITQRGFGIEETEKLSNLIADLLLACKPFSYTGKQGVQARAKIDFDTFHNIRLAVRDLVDNAGIDTDAAVDSYPHFSYIDDKYDDGWHTFSISGKNATHFVNTACTSDVNALQDGDTQPTNILELDGRMMSSGILERVSTTQYNLHIAQQPARTAAWLRSLSDGFVIIDANDIYAKSPGFVDVAYRGTTDAKQADEAAGYAHKPFYIGLNGAQCGGEKAEAQPVFTFAQPTQDALKTTPLHNYHISQKAKMGEFAGYDMPLWYDKVLTEHLAVRNKAGVFDVTHMGVFDVKGKDAETFLNIVTTNDVPRLKVGSSHYTFFLGVDGVPLDDLLIYRLAADHFLLVVNASNNDKNWAWLNAVKDSTAQIDATLPTRCIGTLAFELRDLRAESSGDDRRVDIALQGPHSRDILWQLGDDEAEIEKVTKLAWGQVTYVTLGGFDLIVSRTGYTGERVAYELFPHPDKAAELFEKLIEHGAVPCGLAARDSLRIEAGLPLYGNELAGAHELNPVDAGMGPFVKLHKPFFIGKPALIAKLQNSMSRIARFKMENKGARPAHAGDPIVDGRGRVVGIVTSCSVDSSGYQTGLANLRDGFRKRNTMLNVFAGSEKAKVNGIANLNLGDRVVMPEPIKILRRFPLQKKKK